MTAVSITQRNRENAQKSTRPRTASGKAIVAQNALKHGATGAADPESVVMWLRVILDAPDFTLEDALSSDPRLVPALRLATAEARLAQVLCAQDAMEPMVSPRPDVSEADKVQALIEDFLGIGEYTAETRASVVAIARTELPERIALLKARKEEHRLMDRYVREARAARKKAFQTWVKARSQLKGAPNGAQYLLIPKQSQNSTLG